MKNILKTAVILFLFIGLITTITSCNKTKQYSSLLSGETWKVTAITVDGTPYDILPTLSFNACDIYDEICMAEATTGAPRVANFAWQIRDKGTTFELSDQTREVDNDNQDAVTFTSSFSGVFSITEATKSKMIFNSTATIRYPNKVVIITIEK
jgi:hypothetical protein